MATVAQLPSGLYVASKSFNILRYRATERTVTLEDGERAKITVDDSRTVHHREHGDILDALVLPRTIRLQLRSIK